MRYQDVIGTQAFCEAAQARQDALRNYPHKARDYEPNRPLPDGSLPRFVTPAASYSPGAIGWADSSGAVSDNGDGSWTFRKRTRPEDRMVVDAYDYGVVGDGSDQTAALTAALSAAGGTKELILPAGVIGLSSAPTGWGGRRVRGQRIGGGGIASGHTVIKALDGFSGDSLLNITSGASQLADVTLDAANVKYGITASNTPGPISSFESVAVYNCGVNLGDPTGVRAFNMQTCQIMELHRCVSESSAETGFYAESSNGMLLSHCSFNRSELHDIHVIAGTASGQITIDHCFLHQSGQSGTGYGIYIEGIDEVGDPAWLSHPIITRCWLEGPASGGIRMDHAVCAEIVSNHLIVDTADPTIFGIELRDCKGADVHRNRITPVTGNAPRILDYVGTGNNFERNTSLSNVNPGSVIGVTTSLP